MRWQQTAVLEKPLEVKKCDRIEYKLKLPAIPGVIRPDLILTVYDNAVTAEEAQAMQDGLDRLSVKVRPLRETPK